MDPQIQELIERLRELVITMRETSNTGAVNNNKIETGGDAAKAFTRGSDKIVNAMATLAVKLEGKAKTTAAEERAVNKFAEQVEKITATQDAAAKKIADAATAAAVALKAANDAATLAARSSQQIAADNRSANIKRAGENAKTARQTQDGLAGVWKEFENLGTGSQLLKDKFMSLGGNSRTLGIGLEFASAAAEGAVKSLTGFGAALDKGQRGAAVSAQALSDAVTPLLDFADTLGKIISFGALFLPAGRIVKGIVAAGGALLSLSTSAGKLSLEYIKSSAVAADSLFKSFKELSQSGATAAGGMDDVFVQLQTLGMTLSEIDKFTALISNNSKTLAQFGATAAEGTKLFTEVSGTLAKSEFGKDLELLGFTIQGMHESSLAFMNIQAKTGQLNLKNTKQLIEESGKFAKELDLSARLTGATRKEALEAKEFAQSEERFRAAQIEAEQTGDTERQADLKLAEEISVLAKLNGDTVGQLGTLQTAAARGAASTTEGIAAEQTYNVQGIIQAGREARARGENLSQAQIMDMMAQAAKKTQSLAGSNANLGTISPLQTGIVGPANLINRNDALTKGATEAGFKGPNATEEFLKTAQGKAILEGRKSGSLTGNMTDAGRKQQEAAQNLDSAKLMDMAASVNKIASEYFLDAAKIFRGAVGAKAPAGGGFARSSDNDKNTGTASALGTTPALTDRGKQAEGPALSPAEKAQTAAIADAKAKAQPLIAATAAARKSQEAAQVEVDRLEKANISGAALVAAKAKLATAAEESEKAQAASNAAEIDIRRQTADLAKDQLQQKLMYNQWLEKNIRESRKIGEEIITDETTKKSYAFDEVKLMSKDLDNYERYVKRKEQLTAAELNDIKATRGSEATSNEKKEAETRARAQAQREFAQVAVAATGPATRGTPNPTGAATAIPYVPTAPAPAPAPANPSIYAEDAERAKYKAERQGKITAPKAPAAPSADTAPRTTALGGAPASSATGNSPLANLVARGESTSAGGYDAANAGGTNKAFKAGDKNLTGMTIGDVQAAQAKGEIFAAGRYQITPDTLNEAVQNLNLKTADKFDESMQDRIFKEYLTGAKRPDIQKFLSGDPAADVDVAVLALAKEFASVGVPAATKRLASKGITSLDLQAGDSYYKGVGQNPAIGSITPEEARAALKQTRDQPKMALGGVVKSTPGGVGVIAGEAGRNEAFVPLPDGKSIPVKQDKTVVKDVQNLSAQVMEVVKLLVPQVRILAGIYDTISPFLKSDDNTATLAKRQMPVAPDLATLAGANTPNLGEIASPNIDRADVTSNNIGKLIDELKEQNKSNMKDAMSSVASELKDAFKGMSPQSQDNSSNQELVAAVNEMVRTQRDTNAISSRILQVSQN